MHIFKQLETERLLIRVLELKDKESFHAYRNLPEIYLYQTWGPSNISDAEEFIKKNLATVPNTKDTWLQLAICLRDDTLIGDMGIHFMEDGAQMEIGYTLSPDHQGQGYAFEAGKAVINYLFVTLKKHRITASVDPDNHKSINLLKKLGFRQEAHFEKSILIRGEWCDDIIYAVLAEEWNQSRRIMYELNQVGEKTYYIESPAKMGIYKLNESEVCLIDSGNDKDAGRKVQGILAEQGWTLKFILNTHSNADHVGGNAVLQQRLNAPAYTSGIEACFNRYPLLEPSFLYGGFPVKELRNKFLMASASEANDLADFVLPQGLEILPLEGHYFGMFGVKTDDEIWFLADCMMGENILLKYHASFIYDVAAYLATLEKVEKLEGKWFIPAHAPACQDIKPLVASNRQKVHEISEKLLEWCREPQIFEDLLKQVFDHYQLSMDWNQYVLVGSTVRSYLAYLHDSGKLTSTFENNQLLWCRK